MKLSDLKRKTKIIQVKIDDECADVEYRVHAITPELLNELQTLGDMDGIMRQVEAVVASWDVLDDNGEKIPPSREAILKYGIPLGFLTAVLRAVTDDLQQDSDSKKV